MSNKELQKERMVGYFKQATKELLTGESFSNATVRNIAEKAGYSNAVLYNYFSDVKELIFLSCLEFIDDCTDFIKARGISELNGKDKIKAAMKAYVLYFVQYPVAFKLFYIEPIQTTKSKKNIIDEVTKSLDGLLNEAWQEYIEDEKEREIVKENLFNTLSGLLLMYINRFRPEDYREFMSSIDRQIDWIIK